MLIKDHFTARSKPMNPFRDQEKFMRACDQTTDRQNLEQYQMYCNLIREEFEELMASQTAEDDLDALIDILVVTIGAIHSLGADAEGAWKEVMRTNFAKIDRETGKVRKREDGKVLKPQGWTPPDLKPFVKKQ
jgi:predicted HAD superfamily Cof-like phosphohydrolase